MYLTEAEREHIRLEEQYRSQMREELLASASQTHLGRILTFANSNFGLWLFSAVFIVGTGGVFSCWQHERDRVRASQEQEAARSAKVGKLDREISFRLSHILVELARVVDATEHPERMDSEARTTKLRQARACLHAPADSERNAGLYPDLASYALSALVADLRNEATSKAEREDLDQVLQILALWRNQPLQDAAETGDMIMKALMLERWRQFGFPYTDCSTALKFPCYRLGTETP